MSDQAAQDVDEPAVKANHQASRRRRFLGHPLTHLCAALLLLGLTQAFVVKLFVVPSGSMEETLQVGDRLLVNRLAYGALNKAQPQNGDVVVFSTQEDLWPTGRAQEPAGLIEHAKQVVKFIFGDLIGIGPGTDHMLVKRVIGTPGQTVSCCGENGGLVVDGEEVNEPYIYDGYPFELDSLDCESSPRSQRCFEPVTVPEGMLLVLGDHRGQSSDGIAPCRGVTSSADTATDCARWVRIDDVVGEVFTVVWPLGRFGGIG